MKRVRVIVKLGGSVLTNKSSRGAPRFRAQRARALAQALARVHARVDLVLVLGAGSWGHPQALRHGVGRRILRGRARDAAQKEISASVAQLRRRFCDEALRAGLPVVALSAASFHPARDAARDPLRWMVDGGLVPVLGGDVVADPRRGLRILSGDEIAARLTASLRPARVVFASDVAGVLVKGRVARRLGRPRLRALLPEVDAGSDATGGMRGKLEQALEILDRGVEVRIVDGRRPELVAAACAGRAAGSRLVP